MEPPTKRHNFITPIAGSKAKKAMACSLDADEINSRTKFNKFKSYFLGILGLTALIALLALYSQANWRSQAIRFISSGSLSDTQQVENKLQNVKELNSLQDNQQTAAATPQENFENAKLLKNKNQIASRTNNAKNYHVFLQEPTFSFSNKLPVAYGEVSVVAARASNEIFETIEVQDKIASYISERFRAPFKPIRRLVKITFNTGDISGLDPLLLLAVMATESSFNTRAVSTAGAKGLMQVMASVHSDKFNYFGKVHDVFEPYVNMQVGTRILKDCISRRGDLNSGLKCYVGAKRNSDGGYAKKVLRERQRLRDLIEPTLIQVRNDTKDKSSTVI